MVPLLLHLSTQLFALFRTAAAAALFPSAVGLCSAANSSLCSAVSYGMVHWGYYAELGALEGSCLVMWPLYISQFMAYRFTPPRRRNVHIHRLLQLGALALLFQSVRCVDVSCVFGRVPWTAQAVLSDQVTALMSFATVRVLHVSARTLYALLAKPFPRLLTWLLLGTACVYQLCSAVISVLILAITPRGPVADASDAYSHRLMNLHGSRIFNFEVMCLNISLVSWLTLFGLRGKVRTFARALQEQESHMHRARAAAAGASTLASTTVTMASAMASTLPVQPRHHHHHPAPPPQHLQPPHAPPASMVAWPACTASPASPTAAPGPIQTKPQGPGPRSPPPPPPAAVAAAAPADATATTEPQVTIAAAAEAGANSAPPQQVVRVTSLRVLPAQP